MTEVVQSLHLFLASGQLPVIVLGAGIAAFVFGVTGFGFALVCTPVLLLFLEPTLAIPLVVTVMMVAGLISAIPFRREIPYGLMFLLWIGSSIGTIIGMRILFTANLEMIKLAVGIVVIMSAVFLDRGYKITFHHKKLWGGVMGAISGVLTATTSMGGPPVVLFLLNEGFTSRTFRATILAFSFLTSMNSFVGFALTGVVNAELLAMLMVITPAILIGFITGAKVMSTLRQQWFEKVVRLLIIVFGLIILLEAGFTLLQRS